MCLPTHVCILVANIIYMYTQAYVHLRISYPYMNVLCTCTYMYIYVYTMYMHYVCVCVRITLCTCVCCICMHLLTCVLHVHVHTRVHTHPCIIYVTQMVHKMLVCIHNRFTVMATYLPPLHCGSWFEYWSPTQYLTTAVPGAVHDSECVAVHTPDNQRLRSC